MSTKKSDPISLVDFMKRKRREGCPVCSLSDEIREQLRTASDKKIKRREVLEWLKVEVGADISDSDLTSHNNGRHDEAA